MQHKVRTSSNRLNSGPSPRAGLARRWGTTLQPPCLPALAVCVLAALSLAGCGRGASRLNATTVERAIARSILTERHLYARVECPDKIPRRTGLLFTCTAKLDVGTYPVSATETRGGHIRYQNRTPLIILDIARVEHAIRNSILIQRHVQSTVSCPAEVIQQAGIVFSCTANIHHQSYPFEVTEVDSNGHVRYLGRRRSPLP
jgi:hypothetical protein